MHELIKSCNSIVIKPTSNGSGRWRASVISGRNVNSGWLINCSRSGIGLAKPVLPILQLPVQWRDPPPPPRGYKHRWTTWQCRGGHLHWTSVRLDKLLYSTPSRGNSKRGDTYVNVTMIGSSSVPEHTGAEPHSTSALESALQVHQVPPIPSFTAAGEEEDVGKFSDAWMLQLLYVSHKEEEARGVSGYLCPRSMPAVLLCLPLHPTGFPGNGGLWDISTIISACHRVITGALTESCWIE